MKRRIVRIVSLVVLAGTVVVPAFYLIGPWLFSTVHPAPARKQRQPKVEVAAALVYDFGKMAQMQTNTHTWEVKNAGDAELELWLEEAFSSSAHCTLATPGAKKRVRVKPNETTPVEVQWRTKNFVNSYSQACTIGTNDPTMPAFSLIVKGMVDAAERK